MYGNILILLLPAVALADCEVQLIGSAPLPGYSFDVIAAGDVAYVAAGSDGFHMVDISDPTAPSLLGSFDTPGIVYDLAVRDGIAYVADNYSGVQVVDVSDPTDPALLGTYDEPIGATDIVVDSRYAYVAALDLVILDVQVPESPTLAGTWTSDSALRDLVLDHDTVYAAQLFDGLAIVDVSNRTQPVFLGGEQDGLTADLVTSSGDLAYVLENGGDPGLRVIDVSQPSDPLTLGTLFDAAAGSVAIAPERLFFVSGGHMSVVDVSDPMAPDFLAFYLPLTGGAGNGIAVRNHLAYVVIIGPPHELRVYDISDCLPPCPADIDGDGKVDPFDSNACQARFGCDVNGDDPLCAACDLDGDGVVNPFDSNAVMAAFGECP